MDNSQIPSLPRLSAAAVAALPVGAPVALVEFGPDALLFARFHAAADNGWEISVEFPVEGDPRGGGDWWPFAECVALPSDFAVPAMVV